MRVLSKCDIRSRRFNEAAISFAASLATERRAELTTVDPEFRALEKTIRVGWLK